MPWTKYTCGDSAYYHDAESGQYSLAEPADGVAKEQAEEAGTFGAYLVMARKMDAGELNHKSKARDSIVGWLCADIEEAFDRGINGGKGIVTAEEELVPDAVFLNQHQAVVELEGAVV